MGIVPHPTGRPNRNLPGSTRLDHSVAAALQRVLLPPGLPDLPGWSMAALYEPAGEAVLVGGDFYEWFTVPGGDLLFVLGDVAGKGPVAGALGMSIRKGLKAVTHAIGDPFRALPALEAALADEFGEDGYASLCMLRLSPGSGWVRVLLAGHPVPWVRRAGRFRPIEAPPNRLIGVGVGPSDWRPAEVVLEEGDMIIVFTDGLTEARLPDGRLFEEAGLGDFLATLPDTVAAYDVVLQADSTMRRATSEPSDDIVIAALGFAGPTAAPADVAATLGGETRTLRLSPGGMSARLARRFALDTCEEWDIAEEPRWKVAIVVSELVTNAVLHARTEFKVRLSRHGTQVEVTVADDSPKLLAPNPPDGLLLQHGRGLQTVKALADDFGVETGGGGKRVWAMLSVG